MRFTLLIILLLSCWIAPPIYAGTTIDADKKSAVILAYNRIGEDNYPQTSLRLTDFNAHIQELINGEYNVLPLPLIIEKLKSNEILPQKTVAITFEGGYKSAFKSAVPILLNAKLPFTIFFASDNADRKSGEYMDWNDIKSLKRNKNVNFGILPASYQRVNEIGDEENKRLLNKAKTAFRQHLKSEAELFSYPFGQHNKSYKSFIKSQGFTAAFGLQSGVAYSSMDFYNVPRFTFTDGFGSIERFRTIAGALPIPAIDIEPENHVLKDREPLFGFSVPQKDEHILKSINCFISGLGKAELLRLGQNRLEIRPPFPLDNGRTRINCTANSGTLDAPKWRWFGMLYIIDAQNNSDNMQLNSVTNTQQTVALPSLQE